MKKEKTSSSHLRRFFIISFIIIIIIIILLFSTQIFLWINLMIGNDVIVKTITDKENLFLVNERSEEISFQTSVVTNPFCTASCNFNFVDLSENKIIESSSFNVKPGDPISKNYDLTAPSKGTGQKFYRFDVTCSVQKTFLCHTSGNPESRSSLITLNYDLNENNKNLKESLKNSIILLNKLPNNLLLNLQSLNEINFNLKKNYVEINFSKDFNEISNLTIEFNNSLKNLKDSWEKEEYEYLSLTISEKKSFFDLINKNFQIMNNSIYSNLSLYNFLINYINKTEFRIKFYQKSNFTNTTLIEFNSLIKDFNNITKLLNKKDSAYNKEILMNLLKNKSEFVFNLIDKDYEKNLTLVYISNEPINSLNLSLINENPVYSNYSLNISFKEPSPKCCLFEKCQDCCNDSCFNDNAKYPIIFIHGHDFSKTASSESNLNIFDKIQRKLESQGYLNTGTIFLSSSKEEEKGILGKTFYPVSLKASYYFDILQTKETTTILQTKKDNIDTYSLRLNDIINEVMYKTNREKVILVAYSMGGLVSRRYIQIFGENKIDKLILIAVPNKGISSSISLYCPLIGSELECNDMKGDSLFLNKLNIGKNPKIHVFNIIGLGCDTDGESGDGVVQNSSAYLDFAENYFTNGKCENVNLFHTEILFPDKYPQVYDLIVKSLKESYTVSTG